MPHDPYRCPDCSAELDSPEAACACGYELHPTPETDRELDAWEAMHLPRPGRRDSLGLGGSLALGVILALVLGSIFLVDARQADRAIIAWKADVSAALGAK